MNGEADKPGTQVSDPWIQRVKQKVTPQQIQELHDGFLRYCQMALRDCRHVDDCGRGLAPSVLKTAHHTGRITVKEVATETTASVLTKLAFSTVSSTCCPVTLAPFTISGHRRAVTLPCGCCISAAGLQQSRSAGVCVVCGSPLPSQAVTPDDQHLASLRSQLPLGPQQFPSECRVLHQKDLIDLGCTVKPHATGVGQQVVGPGKDKPLKMGRGTYMLFDHHDEGIIVSNCIFQGAYIQNCPCGPARCCML